jgi:SNF2 family DNA or RNA helicase
MAALAQIINDTNNKIIVFANYKHAIEMISEQLTSDGTAHRVVTGDTPHKERSEIFNEFQDNPLGPRMLLAHPVCMAHGLTLTAADTIVWYGPTYDLEIFDQANARFRRVGQKHKQQVIMLCGTKAEAVAYKRLQSKQKMQGALLDMFETSTKTT